MEEFISKIFEKVVRKNNQNSENCAINFHLTKFNNNCVSVNFLDYNEKAVCQKAYILDFNDNNELLKKQTLECLAAFKDFQNAETDEIYGEDIIFWALTVFRLCLKKNIYENKSIFVVFGGMTKGFKIDIYKNGWHKNAICEEMKIYLDWNYETVLSQLKECYDIIKNL